jgi:hypothetical protein
MQNVKSAVVGIIMEQHFSISHYFHSGLDKPLLCGAVLCIDRCLVCPWPKLTRCK